MTMINDREVQKWDAEKYGCVRELLLGLFTWGTDFRHIGFNT